MAVSLDTRLTALLGCRYPIIQTAMGWVADPRLVAATCNAGALAFWPGRPSNLGRWRQRSSRPNA